MSQQANPDRTCQACGAVLVEDALGGLCPKCLLRMGFEDGERQLRIRCPQCHVAIQIVDDASLREVTCPSCDSRFSLVGDQTAAYQAEGGGRVGQFDLLARVGVGAFGTVWKARDLELDRIVAIKIPRKEQPTADEAEQFLREARSAAKLRHPGIVSVHEVGRDGDRFYIVSDFIDGVTLADALSADRPTMRDSAEICRLVAEALQHAHSRGVIHRDLKPSNIMLDDAGRPHVMDFGLAKRDAAEITVTIDGQILGTPAYMSPEQARGEGHRADARSDVYSLGVILFELLTGEKPFRGTSQMLLQQVLREDAPSPRKLNGKVPRDLETICLKCLEKEPSRRFPSAQSLADELGRFLDGRPIESRPITAIQRGWRWCGRNPIVAALTTAVAASLLIGLATTAWQWGNAQVSFEDANQARGLAERRSQETAAALDESQSRLARVFVERGLQEIDVAPHAGLPWLVQALKTEPEASAARDMHRLRIGLMLDELPKLLGFWPSAVDAKFSSDGMKLAVAAGREALVYELPTMRRIGPLQHDRPVAGVYFTRQGDRLATVAREENGTPACRIWETRSGKAVTEAREFEDDGFWMWETPSITFTEDGESFVAVRSGLSNRWHSQMTARVFDSETLEPLWPTFAHHSELDVSEYFELSPDTLRVLVPKGLPAYDTRVPWVDADDWPDDIRPQQYDLTSGLAMHPPLDHELDFYAGGQFVYSADGSLIATSSEGVVKIWDGKSGELRKELKLPREGDPVLQFHPDGKSLFSIDRQRAYWWDINTGAVKDEWEHKDKFFVSPTGQYAAYTDSGNGATYVWDVNEKRNKEFQLPDISRVRFCRDGSRFLHFAAKRVYESADGRAITPQWRFNGRGIEDPFSENGRYSLTKEDAGVWLWDLDATRKIVEEFPAGRSQKVIDAAFSRDRKTIAVLTEDCQLSCWDADSGRPRGTPFRIPIATSAGKAINWKSMVLHPAADKVAVIGEYRDPRPDYEDRNVDLFQVWDLTARAPLLGPIAFDTERNSWIETVQFIGNGDQLAITEFIHDWSHDRPSIDRTRLHVYELASGLPSRAPQEFEHTLRLVDVTADGKRCLVVRRDGRWIGGEGDPVFKQGVAQIYSTATWQPLTPMMTPSKGHAPNAVLSPDGSRVVMGDGEVWDAGTGSRLVGARIQHRAASDFVFNRDGSAFVLVSEGGSNYRNATNEMRLLSTSDGKSLSRPMTNTKIGAPACAVHPESKLIVAAGHGLRLWDGESGTMLNSAINLHVVDLPSGSWRDPHRKSVFSANGRRLYIRMGADLLAVRLGEIVDSIPPDDVLEAWAGILSGERIDAQGGVVPMTADDHHAAWRIVSVNLLKRERKTD